MNTSMQAMRRFIAYTLYTGLAGVALAFFALPETAQAVPAFNRQTGQNCVACHAGGQFPELGSMPFRVERDSLI